MNNKRPIHIGRAGAGQAVFFILVLLLGWNPAVGQVPGELPMAPAESEDTVMVFLSPRPLVAEENAEGARLDAWGLDILFSSNGFGLGAFYRHEYSPNLFGFVHLGISGAKKTDEFEKFDIDRGRYIPDKINRLYMIPITFGIQQRLFSDDLSDSFKPYLQGGIGGTFIISTPYSKEFFSAFGSSDTFLRPGGFLGVGAYIGESKNNLTAVNVRYYVIPFGGKGIESVREFPITDFGGLFLSLSVGIIN